MTRNMAVGLLAAVGAAMSALVGLSHGDIIGVMLADAAVATGFAAYLALPPSKKIPRTVTILHPAAKDGRSDGSVRYRTGSVKWRRSRSRRDAVGALDRFRETSTVVRRVRGGVPLTLCLAASVCF